jgi:hypothetical protein
MIIATLLLGAVLAWGLIATPVPAITPFTKAFEERYVKDHPDTAFRTAFRKTRCDVCHIKGKPKTANNPYGDALAKFLEGNAEERIKEARAMGRLKEEEQILLKELAAAFDQVEKIKCDPNDESAPTYGERIQQGKLPAATE